MPHTFTQGTVLVGRILAFAVGALAFYAAFFLFEDEDGVWQNRIDNFWVAVDERVKVTNNTATAIFNQIGGFLNKAFDGVFGNRLLSLRAVSVSINLSLGGGLLAIVVAYQEFDEIGAIAVICAGVAFCFMALAIKHPSNTTALVSLVPTGLFVFYAARLLDDPQIIAESQPVVVLLSLGSDFLGIVIMRRLFVTLSSTVSLLRVTSCMTVLLLFVTLIAVFPIYGSIWFIDHVAANTIGSLIYLIFSIELVASNFTTAVLCTIPTLALIVVLLHRILWPALSRVVYPLCRFKIVTNRKALISAGTICITVGLNLERVGWKLLLDHIK